MTTMDNDNGDDSYHEIGTLDIDDLEVVLKFLKYQLTLPM